jgi:hypothetical protein
MTTIIPGTFTEHVTLQLLNIMKYDIQNISHLGIF